ncbi:MAG: oligopeptide transporter, OPT family, partial [Planctomycetota bacterium]|nr:oligopeptide transporter, OPT family [Planctomycetota bacterium]
GYDGLVADDPDLYSAVKVKLRYLGVGAMIVGGLWSILMIRKGIAQGLRETFGSYKASRHAESPPDRTEIDMERRWIVLLIAATAVAILGLYFHVTGNFGVSALATALMVICSFFFVAVAAYIVGLVGSSNSPVSGMTICSVLITSAFIFLFGFRGDIAILATLGVAGVVCCAACTSGDVCQDLKTGHLVGATPYRQQWVEVLGVVTAAFVMQPILRILHAGYGIGTDAHLAPALQGKALEAPQAQLFASLMEGFFGDGTVPWGLVAIGAGIGIAIVVSDSILRGAGSGFRLHVMPVAVGMYLPFGLVTAILVGGLLSWFAGRGASSEADRRRGMERGVLLASGLIAGEAICGVLIAIPRANKIVLPTLLSSQPALMGGLTVAALVGVALWMVAAARPRSS